MLPTWSWRPSVPSCARVLQQGTCREEGGVHVVLLCSHFHLRIGTIACHQRATALSSVFVVAARSPLQALDGSVSYFVTEPFPFLRPWHCVHVSLLPRCSCHHESLPHKRLAHRARSCAFGNLSTNANLCPRPLLCSSVEKATALCGDSLMHHVCQCATLCERLVPR